MDTPFSQHCNTLQHNAAHCNNTMHHHTVTPHCNTCRHDQYAHTAVQRIPHSLNTATQCNTLKHTATTHCISRTATVRCNDTLQHAATRYNTLQQRTAITHCNCTLQLHTATHCNMLQHTETTHCNTWSYQQYAHTAAEIDTLFSQRCNTLQHAASRHCNKTL